VPSVDVAREVGCTVIAVEGTIDGLNCAGCSLEHIYPLTQLSELLACQNRRPVKWEEGREGKGGRIASTADTNSITTGSNANKAGGKPGMSKK
jgi:hypothetical protein